MSKELVERLPVLPKPVRFLTKFRTYYRKAFRPIIIRNHGIYLPIDATLSDRMSQLLYEQKYENREVRIVRERLEPDDRMLELGTGIGFVTTVAAKICGSESTFTFEANPEMVPIIEKVFELNGVNPILRNAAVARKPTKLEFFLCDDFWSSSVYDRENTKLRIECDAFGFVETIEQIQPTFLIMDIEGGEYDLVGLKIGNSVVKIMIELHEHVVKPGGIEEVRNWLQREGFSVIEDHGDRSVIYLERL